MISLFLKKIAAELQQDSSIERQTFFAIVEALLEQFNYQLKNKKINQEDVLEYEYQKKGIQVKIEDMKTYFNLRFYPATRILQNTKIIEKELKQLLYFENNLSLSVTPSFLIFGFGRFSINFVRLRHALELIFTNVEQILTNSKHVIYHACGEDFTPGWHALKGVVYHGISRSYETSIPHLRTAPLHKHFEYPFRSISTTCNLETALEFAKKGIYSIIQYRIDTNRLYVLEEGKYISKIEADAILIPLGGLIEHEIAVLNPKVLTPNAVFISIAGSNQYKKIMIPKDEAAIQKLEAQLLQYGKEQDKLRIEKSKEVDFIRTQLYREFPDYVFSLSFSNYLPNQGYRVYLQKEGNQKLIEELNQHFPLFIFSKTYFQIIIDFDSLPLFTKNFSKILSYIGYSTSSKI